MKPFNLMLAAVLISAWLCGCANNPVTGKKQLRLISEDQEIALGVESAPQFEQQLGGQITDPQVTAYVTALGKKIAAASERPKLPWQFTVLRDATPNAFALPGGKVFITAGLFKILDNERQLVAVLGHEVGHVCYEHSVQAMQRQMGAEVFASAVSKASGNPNAESAAKVASSMLLLKYDRTQEYEADVQGVVYAQKLGYGPWGMVEALEHLQKLGAEGGKLEEMFSTHPLTSARVKAAEKAIHDKYPNVPRPAVAPDPTFLQMRQKL